jgi:acyl carrier protein
MITREEIFAHLQQLLVSQFELDADAVTPTARLYDDLDIDSIDAVDLMIELKSYTGRKLNPEIFKTIKTVDDVVSAICDLMTEPSRHDHADVA